MTKTHIKIVTIITPLIVVSLACSFFESFAKNQEPENVSATANMITRPVKVSENPSATTLLNCPITQNIPDNKNAWVKFSDNDYPSVNVMEMDKEGRMWLATDGYGLRMFDGKRLHIWEPETHKDMSYDAIRTMAMSSTKIYAGAYGSSDGGNLLVYDINNDQWQTISPGENSIRNNVIGGVAVNKQGKVYAMTKDGLDVLDNNKWTYFGNPLESKSMLFSAKNALFDVDGNYWVATTNGVWKFDGKDWTSWFSAKKGEWPSSSVDAIAIDQNNRIWAATTSGLAVYSNEKWFYFSPEQFPWYQESLDNIAIDTQNRVWVMNRKTLSVYNGTEAILFTPEYIHENIWYQALGFDKEGCVWVGRSLGMVVFQGKLDLAPGDFEFLK